MQREASRLPSPQMLQNEAHARLGPECAIGLVSSHVCPTYLLGPQFQPPVWSIGGPISPCPQGAWTQFQVVHSDMSPRSCLLSCEPLALS